MTVMQFFDETDDTAQKRIGKVLGAINTAIIYSGVATSTIYAALQRFR